MHNDVLVSVVVPIYMVQKYLPKCVKSIINQTHQNLEIILVDDGSKDDCGRICDTFSKEDDRIKVIHKENGGLSDARNAGIEIATGDYIVFVDSDDYIHPQMIEYLLKPVQEGIADLSVCQFEYIQDNEESIYTQIDDAKYIIIENYPDKTKYYFNESEYDTFTVAWNKLYPLNYFSDIRYPKGKIHEDEFTTYKLLEKADKVAYIEYPFYYYIQRNNSIMGDGFTLKSLDKYDAYHDRIEYYVRKGNYCWAEKIHALYRILFIKDIRKINRSEKFDLSVLDNALKRYSDITLKNVLKYPIPMKKKCGYLFMAVFPKLYIKRQT